MHSHQPQTLQWNGDEGGYLTLIDQTALPLNVTTVDCRNLESVVQAIRVLQVRGAPAIGIAAAYGICVGLQTIDVNQCTIQQFEERLQHCVDQLANSRPTAVNLFWALQRMQDVAQTMWQAGQLPSQIMPALLNEALAIHDEDREMCHAIGKHGATLLDDGQGVLTHCNAGGLATSEYGTALSVLFSAQDQGKTLHVFVDETRPLLQGARLTAWECQQRNIATTLICDNMAAQVMSEGKIQAVITGADRIAANGDVANKIGTYGLAILAKHHQIPFYVAAPSNTFDLSLSTGKGIPIEQRSSDEITQGFGTQTAPDGINTYNPAFDVTPAELITAIITEQGIISPVSSAAIAALL